MLDKSKIYQSNNYGEFVIVNYINAKTITVKFLKTGYQKVSTKREILKGVVKDKMLPSLYGVGFVGAGEFKASDSGSHTEVYLRWKGILERCYCPRSLKRKPCYLGCSVAEVWHNFQNFAAWFEKNHIAGFDIDKDIKIPGNKVYSPDACCFVSPTENRSIAGAKRYVFLSPKGESVDIYNLSEFCRKNNLNHRVMCSVHTGRVQHHKGWRKDF
jgi:hypothetical protein